MPQGPFSVRLSSLYCCFYSLEFYTFNYMSRYQFGAEKAFELFLEKSESIAQGEDVVANHIKQSTDASLMSTTAVQVSRAYGGYSPDPFLVASFT